MSDGYFNSRVAMRQERTLRQVGRRSRDAAVSVQHATLDHADANGNIYVADRNNRRIQVFDSNLVLRAIYDHVGAPWAVCISPGPHQYLFSSNSNPDNNNSLLAAVAGEIYKMELDGTVIGKFGKPGKQLGEFSTVHAIDCRNPDELIVVEITAWRAEDPPQADDAIVHDSARDCEGSMTRALKLATAALALLGVPVTAQLSIPEIPYDAVDPLKLPDDLYLGEAAGVATNSRETSSSTRGPATRQPRSARDAPSRVARGLFAFDPSGKFIREIGQGSTASFRAHRESTARTTSGSSTKARTW